MRALTLSADKGVSTAMVLPRRRGQGRKTSGEYEEVSSKTTPVCLVLLDPLSCSVSSLLSSCGVVMAVVAVADDRGVVEEERAIGLFNMSKFLLS